MQEQTTIQKEPIVPSQLIVKQSEIADNVSTDVVLDVQSLEVYYGAFRAVKDGAMPIQSNKVTAFIGPSGCGKSTVLRCFNRMNDLIRGARIGGKILFRRRGPVRCRHRPDRDALPHRYGLSEAEPFPQVHLR